MSEEKMSAETYVVSGGRPAHEHDAPVNPPIILSSPYRGAGTVDTVSDKVYARFANPTWEAMEEVVAGLEGGTHGLLFPSGMAAIASILDLVPVGSVILIPKHAYMASITMSKDLQKRGIAEVVRIDLEDTDSVIAAFEDAAARTGVTPETVDYAAPKVLAWLESPTNPMLEVADLPAICAAAKRLGVVTAVDNTFATPILQKPLSFGADVVVHSATKFLAGHSDVLLGVTVTSNEDLYQAMLHHRITNGAIPGPVEAWLGLRGLRTLALRVERSVHNAQRLAERLSEHPAVEEVRYPGLPGSNGHELAKKQMHGGVGAGLWGGRKEERGGSGAAISAEQAGTREMHAIMGASDVRSADMDAKGANLSIVVSDSMGKGGAMVDGQPVVDAGMGAQVWAVGQDGTMRSAGVIGPEPHSDVWMPLPANIEKVMVTEEPMAGSHQPTGRVLAETPL